MKKVWNQEKDDYLKQIYKDRASKEIAKLMSEKFNMIFTDKSISARKIILRLFSGHSYCRKYPKEITDYIKNHYKGKSSIELSNEVNKVFGLNTNNDTIQNLKSKIKRNEGFIFELARNDGCFKKGQESWNKGTKGLTHANKTSFKKGNIPINHRTVGSERINIYGYVEIKIEEPNKWELKHRWLWKKENGKIPKGYKVIFKDGNKNNITLGNLALVSNSQMLILNRNNLIFEESELTETGINIAKVLDKVNEKSRL